MSNIGIVSFVTPLIDTEQYRKVIYNSLHEYCLSYDIDLLHHGNAHPERIDRYSYHWDKILYMITYLKENEYDWLIWMDADVVIMNHNYDIRYFIDESKNITIARDYDHFTRWINTGVFAVKNTEWSTNFLKDVYFGDNFFTRHPTMKSWDQGSFMLTMGRLAQRELDENFHIDQRNGFNKFMPSFASDIQTFHDILLDINTHDYFIPNVKMDRIFRKGDFACHLFSRRQDTKDEWLQELKHHIIWD